MKVAIVGSVSLAGNAEVYRIIDDVIDRLRPTHIVSGGASGVDSMAEDRALQRGIPVLIHRPRHRRWGGPGGFKERNQRIADECDYLVRIVASNSTTYGSGWTRDRAKEQGKPCEEYVIGVP